MCCGTPIGPSYQFTLEIPKEISIEEATTLLRKQDEYNSRGREFPNPHDYRQYECLCGLPLTNLVQIRCDSSSEPILRKVLFEFLVSQLN